MRHARFYQYTNGRPPTLNSAAMIVTSSSNNITPTYWVSTHDPTLTPSVLPPGSAHQQRRTASSGLLMNIGYLDNGSTPVTASEAAETLSTLPRPASAGAAAALVNGEDTLLYEYPPSVTLASAPVKAGTASSRHRGVNLRKQHSVSCASHCCEQVPKV